MSNESLLESMGLTFPSTPTDLDTGTDFSTSLSEVTNPIYRQTPVSYGADSVVVAAQKEFEKLFPEWAAPLAAALAGAGIISSLASSGPAKVEVTAQKPVTPPPAEPPPTPTTPPPVIPAPVSPSVDPADPTKEVPKQDITPEEAEKLGIPKELLPLLLKYGLGALASYLSYKSAKDAQEQARGASFTSRGPVTSTRRAYQGSTYKPAAQGGLMALAGGGVLNEKGPEDYGIGSLAEDMSIGEYEPEQFNSDTFYQAYANDVYAPEGLIANEVVKRAAFELPETFDPRNLAFQKEKEASINEARNRLLSEVMSVDQITGDIDPIQSIKNIAAYDPTFSTIRTRFKKICRKCAKP